MSILPSSKELLEPEYVIKVFHQTEQLSLTATADETVEQFLERLFVKLRKQRETRTSRGLSFSFSRRVSGSEEEKYHLADDHLKLVKLGGAELESSILLDNFDKFEDDAKRKKGDGEVVFELQLIKSVMVREATFAVTVTHARSGTAYDFLATATEKCDAFTDKVLAHFQRRHHIQLIQDWKLVRRGSRLALKAGVPILDQCDDCPFGLELVRAPRTPLHVLFLDERLPFAAGEGDTTAAFQERVLACERVVNYLRERYEHDSHGGTGSKPFAGLRLVRKNGQTLTRAFILDHFDTLPGGGSFTARSGPLSRSPSPSPATGSAPTDRSAAATVKGREGEPPQPHGQSKPCELRLMEYASPLAAGSRRAPSPANGLTASPSPSSPRSPIKRPPSPNSRAAAASSAPRSAGPLSSSPSSARSQLPAAAALVSPSPSSQRHDSSRGHSAAPSSASAAKPPRVPAHDSSHSFRPAPMPASAGGGRVAHLFDHLMQQQGGGGDVDDLHAADPSSAAPPPLLINHPPSSKKKKKKPSNKAGATQDSGSSDESSAGGGAGGYFFNPTPNSAAPSALHQPQPSSSSATHLSPPSSPGLKPPSPGGRRPGSAQRDARANSPSRQQAVYRAGGGDGGESGDGSSPPTSPPPSSQSGKRRDLVGESRAKKQAQIRAKREQQQRAAGLPIQPQHPSGGGGGGGGDAAKALAAAVAKKRVMQSDTDRLLAEQLKQQDELLRGREPSLAALDRNAFRPSAGSGVHTANDDDGTPTVVTSATLSSTLAEAHSPAHTQDDFTGTENDDDGEMVELPDDDDDPVPAALNGARAARVSQASAASTATNATTATQAVRRQAAVDKLNAMEVFVFDDVSSDVGDGGSLSRSFKGAAPDGQSFSTSEVNSFLDRAGPALDGW